MKQKFSFLLLPTLIVSIAVLVSCSKDYVSPLSGRTIDDITFGPELSYKTIKFDGQDLSNITASSSEGWCQAYAKGSELIVNVIDNFTYSERTSNIVVLDNTTGDQLTFKATQLQNDAILPDESIYEVPAEGGIVTMSLQTNVKIDWVNIVSDYSDFIYPGTRSVTRGLVAYEDYVTVAANDHGEEREGYVEFGNMALNLKTSVLIRQAARPYIRLDKEYVSIDENGGEVDIQVEANLDFRAEPHESWVQAGEQRELSKYKYSQKLKVSPMSGNGTSRRCVVYFVNDDLTVHNMLTIVQEKKQ